MPDYEIDILNKEVGVRIYGNSINEKYTKSLTISLRLWVTPLGRICNPTKLRSVCLSILFLLFSGNVFPRKV